MIEHRGRRLTIADGLILVAATAAGLAIIKDGVLGVAMPRALAGFFSRPPEGWWSRKLFVRGVGALVLAAPFVAVWTLAYMTIRLRGPRPPIQRLARQPGFAVGVAALIVLTTGAVAAISDIRAQGRLSYLNASRLQEYTLNMTILLSQRIGLAVLVAWITMRLARAWRPERSWIDRLGCALGVFWIIASAAFGFFMDRAVWWGTFLDFG